MKSKNILLALLIVCLNAAAQTPCQSSICLIDYSYHIDTSPNPAMAAIDSFKPALLVCNTPHGLYGDQDLPAVYHPFGIQVYSYITGGYEGSKYMTSEDDSATNIGRIDGIALDGADGVMLDEVSSILTPQKKGYITAMFNKCRAKSLKLIVNPGDNSFDTFLISHSDYVISSENFTGMTPPSSSELAAMSHMIVLNYRQCTK